MEKKNGVAESLPWQGAKAIMHTTSPPGDFYKVQSVKDEVIFVLHNISHAGEVSFGFIGSYQSGMQ